MSANATTLNDIKPHPEKRAAASDDAQVYDDGTNTYFWQAHTVTALVFIMCGLIYVTFFEETSHETGYNMGRGAVAVVVVFILIGVVHMPNGPFIRPHPVVWRLFLCLIILYILMLIFALFQTIDDARQLLRVYDPELGKPLPERTYAENCDIYTPGHPNGSFANVMEKMDVFVPCHLIGWFVKALILRDYWLLTILSAWFELMEYTLECQLPNFGECWWDHWILDFLLCNGLGMWAGMRVSAWLEMKTYHWMGLWKIPTFKGKLKRAVSQFTPHSWTHYRWGYTESFKRFCFVCIIATFCLVQEVNTFYLKTILWIPPDHMLNFYRLVMYAICGTAALKEMYDYLSSSDKNAEIGHFSWLVVAAILCEVLFEIKFGSDIMSISPHPLILAGWVVLLVVFLIWTFWHFTVPFRDMPVIGSYWRRLEDKIKQQ